MDGRYSLCIVKFDMKIHGEHEKNQFGENFVFLEFWNHEIKSIRSADFRLGRILM
jgi:hypothetical protein